MTAAIFNGDAVKILKNKLRFKNGQDISWNTTEKTIDIETGIGGVVLQVGQENFIYVYNDTGAQIDNGTPIYINGANSGTPTIDLASACEATASRCKGVTTMDIPDESYGFVTAFGLVRDIDTSGLSSGKVYLSCTPGELTSDRPDDGNFSVEVGEVLVVDGTNGLLFCDPNASELTVEVTDTNGFPDGERTNTTLSFVDGTRTFTITPTGDDFHFYELGMKYTKTGADSIVISADEGMHCIYYDSGVLSELLNPNDSQFENIIINKTVVALVYWDATNSTAVYLGDERHGISMSPKTHAYLHVTQGAKFISGLALGDVLADENGSSNTHAQFSVGSGVIADEDINHTIPAVASTVGLPIYVLEGSTPNLRKYSETGFSVLTDNTAGVDTTGKLVYNEFTGGSWQLSLVSNNDFVLCHVFAINGISGGDQWAAFVGQEAYTTLGLARAGAETEINSLVSIIPLPEIVPVATIIFRTNDSYTNAVKAAVISTAEGDDFIDWRTTQIAGGAAPTNHGNLSGLELSDTGVTYGHIDDQAQDIYGAKDFKSGIKLNGSLTATSILDQDDMSSDSAEALATQQSVKAYVDSNPVGALTSSDVVDEDDMSSDSDELVPTQQSVKAYVGSNPVGALTSSDVVDEDDMSSDSDELVPTQQSVKAYVDNATGIVTPNSTTTFTNKTISASNNSITNLGVANLASGVLDTDLGSASSNDDTLASAKAIKAFAESLELKVYSGAVTETSGSQTLTDGSTVLWDTTIYGSAYFDSSDEYFEMPANGFGFVFANIISQSLVASANQYFTIGVTVNGVLKQYGNFDASDSDAVERRFSSRVGYFGSFSSGDKIRIAVSENIGNDIDMENDAKFSHFGFILLS